MSQTPRYLRTVIETDALALGKMAFISGPRQVGKTTLARDFVNSSENYFSWDITSFRKAWTRDPEAAVSLRAPGPVVIDEIHKDRLWKSRLKGIYDTHGSDFPIIVTGSAKLDLYRRGGDSLMGRYIPYRLHPFTVGERQSPPSPDKVFDMDRKPNYPWADLLVFGGFPEPLLRANLAHARRWSRLRLERLTREDVRDLRNVSDLQRLQVLTELLPEKVGSLLSINSLREDLGVAYGTVRAWIQLLEALYHCILIRPYSGTIRRALSAEPKLYLFDCLQISNEAARRENLTALHLLKACQFWTDTAQGEFDLRYFRTKDKKEIDFVVLRDKKPWLLVECKSHSKTPSSTLERYAKAFRTKHNIQLVESPGYRRDYPALGISVRDYEAFFASWC